MYTQKRFIANKIYQLMYFLTVFFQIGFLLNYDNLRTRIISGHYSFLLINLGFLLLLSFTLLIKVNKLFFSVFIFSIMQFVTLYFNNRFFYLICSFVLFVEVFSLLWKTLVGDYYYYSHLNVEDLSFVEDLFERHLNTSFLTFNLIEDNLIEIKTKSYPTFFIERLKNGDLLFFDKGNISKEYKVSFDEVKFPVFNMGKNKLSKTTLELKNLENEINRQEICLHTNIIDIEDSVVFYLDLIYEINFACVFEKGNDLDKILEKENNEERD